MKGMSLSINMVIILILAVVVLVAVIVFFNQSASSSSDRISEMEAWQRGCGEAKLKGCETSFFEKGNEEEIEISNFRGNLSEACEKVYSYTSAEECMKACCN